MALDKEKSKIWAKQEKYWGVRFSPEFREAVERTIGDDPDDEAFLKDFENYLPDYIKIGITYGSSNRGDSATDGEHAKALPKRIYRKCLERRSYLVNFVDDKNGPRIDWRRTVTEWNKAHPSDPMTLPVMKAVYYRARKKGVSKNVTIYAPVVTIVAQALPPKVKVFATKLGDAIQNMPADKRIETMNFLNSLAVKEAQHERSHSQEVQE